MQIGSSYSHATPRSALMEFEQAGVLDQQQRALVGMGEAGADADALVLLADADQTRIGAIRQRPQQAVAGGDIGHRDDEGNAGRFDLAQNGLAGQALRRRRWTPCPCDSPPDILRIAGLAPAIREATLAGPRCQGEASIAAFSSRGCRRSGYGRSAAAPWRDRPEARACIPCRRRRLRRRRRSCCR